LARAGPIVRALPRRAPPEGAGLGTTRARRREAPRTGRSARRRSPRRERDPRGALARTRRVACLQYDIKTDVMSSHPGIMLALVGDRGGSGAHASFADASFYGDLAGSL